jgi:transcriptional regulator with XRE-family HTH domain
MTEREILARRLREAREYLGLTQDVAAKALGLARPAYTNIEAARQSITAPQLASLARLYRTTPNMLLGVEEYAPPADLVAATADLSEQDRQQVLRFAQFLKHAGVPNKPRVIEG